MYKKKSITYFAFGGNEQKKKNKKKRTTKKRKEKKRENTVNPGYTRLCCEAALSDTEL